MLPVECAELIYTCAKFMNNAKCATGPSATGRAICEREATKLGQSVYGELVYYLLTYCWNDTLDWARSQLSTCQFTLVERRPTKRQIAKAKAEIRREDEARMRRLNSDPVRKAQEKEIERRASLPSEHPDHICGRMCDGQDGSNSECARLRDRLFGG